MKLWFRVLVGVGVLGGLLVIFSSFPSGTATGGIRSTGNPHGDFEVRPVTCMDGEHWSFQGVWVVPETETSGSRSGFRGGLKLVKNEGGRIEVYVENPKRCQGFTCEQRNVQRQFCSQFDVVLKDGKLPFRQDGHAYIDCRFPETGTLQVKLDFSGCARVASSGAEP